MEAVFNLSGLNSQISCHFSLTFSPVLKRSSFQSLLKPNCFSERPFKLLQVLQVWCFSHEIVFSKETIITPQGCILSRDMQVLWRSFHLMMVFCSIPQTVKLFAPSNTVQLFCHLWTSFHGRLCSKDKISHSVAFSIRGLRWTRSHNSFCQ